MNIARKCYARYWATRSSRCNKAVPPKRYFRSEMDAASFCPDALSTSVCIEIRRQKSCMSATEKLTYLRKEFEQQFSIIQKVKYIQIKSTTGDVERPTKN